MAKIQAYRHTNLIHFLNDGPVVTKYPSIAIAKRRSRKIQMDTDGALGLGSVKVITDKNVWRKMTQSFSILTLKGA